MTDAIFRFILFLFFVSFPLFFLPLTSETHEYPKLMLLFFFTFVFLISFSSRVFRDSRVRISRNPFLLPFFLLIVLSLGSFLIHTPYSVASLTTPLSATTLLGLFLVFLVFSTEIGTHDRYLLMYALEIAATIISLFVILLYSGFLPQNVLTPAGNLLTTLLFLLCLCLFLGLQLLTDHLPLFWTLSRRVLRSIALFSLALFLWASLLLIIHLLSDQKPILLPFSFGLTIAFELLKNTQTFFFGVGPTNFISAYTLTKPLALNATPLWNITFSSSSSFALTLLTEIGFLAGLCLVWILFSSLRLFWITLRQPTRRDLLPFSFSLVFSLLLLFLLPTGMSLILLVVVFLSFSVSDDTTSFFTFSFPKLASFFLLLLISVSSAIACFLLVRSYIAEVFFSRATVSLSRSNGSDAYKLLHQAITYNPFIDRYHVTFSKTNVAIAQTLSLKDSSTDEEKQAIPQFVQQAIEEAKIATTLSPTNISNWNALAQIYVSLLHFAEGSSDWAITSYERMIALDPYNPMPRLFLGTLYRGLARYDDALRMFDAALSLKSDSAPAYIGKGFTLRDMERYSDALEALRSAQMFLPPDTQETQELLQEIQKIVTLSNEKSQ